jgi:hypothetical protein
VDASSWLACQEPEKLLEWLRHNGRASDRKLRLFAAACVRRVWDRLRDERCREAVSVCERFADGLATLAQLDAAQVAAGQAQDDAYVAQLDDAAPQELSAAFWASTAVLELTYSPCEEAVVDAIQWAASTFCFGEFEPTGPEEAVQCQVLRCVFANPFRPLTLNPALLSWHGGLIPKLAQAAYDGRILPAGTLDPAHLAVLCDALEESGLAAPEMLAHLRGGPHWRGCHAIDVLLGQ